MKRSKRYGSKRNSRETWNAWAFLLPSFLGVLMFILIPFLDVIRRSFMEAMSSTFVGFDNYAGVLKNKAFRQAVGNTGRFLLTCIPLLLVLSLILALLIHVFTGLNRNQAPGSRKGKKGEFFKTSYLVPMAIPVASVALLWKLLFRENGLLNVFLINIGSTPVDFMNSELAFYVLVFSYLWKNTGYDMVLWLAGLNGISQSLYEAAGVDGAGACAKFRYITLPGLKPVLFVTAVLSLVNSFKVFREAYLIAGDYPHGSIYMLQHIFNNWFVSLDMQKMSAAAVLTAIVVLLIIGGFALIAGRDDKEE